MYKSESRENRTKDDSNFQNRSLLQRKFPKLEIELENYTQEIEATFEVCRDHTHPEPPGTQNPDPNNFAFSTTLHK